MSDEVDNRATIEAHWQVWNEERVDQAVKMYARDARLRHLNHGIDVTGSDNDPRPHGDDTCCVSWSSERCPSNHRRRRRRNY